MASGTSLELSTRASQSIPLHTSSQPSLGMTSSNSATGGSSVAELNSKEVDLPFQNFFGFLIATCRSS
jgi:hypothetical protein